MLKEGGSVLLSKDNGLVNVSLLPFLSQEEYEKYWMSHTKVKAITVTYFSPFGLKGR